MIRQRKDAQQFCRGLAALRGMLTSLPSIVQLETEMMQRGFLQTTRKADRLLADMDAIVGSTFKDATPKCIRRAEAFFIRQAIGRMSLLQRYASAHAPSLATYVEPAAPDFHPVAFEAAVCAEQAPGGMRPQVGNLRFKKKADAILCLSTLYAVRSELIYMCSATRFQSTKARLQFCRAVGEVLLLILYGILRPIYRQEPSLTPPSFNQVLGMRSD